MAHGFGQPSRFVGEQGAQVEVGSCIFRCEPQCVFEGGNRLGLPTCDGEETAEIEVEPGEFGLKL
ncbi:hypothetical protein D3C83_272090 [compost metagenome]